MKFLKRFASSRLTTSCSPELSYLIPAFVGLLYLLKLNVGRDVTALLGFDANQEMLLRVAFFFLICFMANGGVSKRKTRGYMARLRNLKPAHLAIVLAVTVIACAVSSFTRAGSEQGTGQQARFTMPDLEQERQDVQYVGHRALNLLQRVLSQDDQTIPPDGFSAGQQVYNSDAVETFQPAYNSEASILHQQSSYNSEMPKSYIVEEPTLPSPSLYDTPSSLPQPLVMKEIGSPVTSESRDAASNNTSPTAYSSTSTEQESESSSEDTSTATETSEGTDTTVWTSPTTSITTPTSPTSPETSSNFDYDKEFSSERATVDETLKLFSESYTDGTTSSAIKPPLTGSTEISTSSWEISSSACINDRTTSVKHVRFNEDKRWKSCSSSERMEVCSPLKLATMPPRKPTVAQKLLRQYASNHCAKKPHGRLKGAMCCNWCREGQSNSTAEVFSTPLAPLSYNKMGKETVTELSRAISDTVTQYYEKLNSNLIGHQVQGETEKPVFMPLKMINVDRPQNLPSSSGPISYSKLSPNNGTQTQTGGFTKGQSPQVNPLTAQQSSLVRDGTNQCKQMCSPASQGGRSPEYSNGFDQHRPGSLLTNSYLMRPEPLLPRGTQVKTSDLPSLFKPGWETLKALPQNRLWVIRERKKEVETNNLSCRKPLSSKQTLVLEAIPKPKTYRP